MQTAAAQIAADASPYTAAQIATAQESIARQARSDYRVKVARVGISDVRCFRCLPDELLPALIVLGPQPAFDHYCAALAGCARSRSPLVEFIIEQIAVRERA